MIGRRQLPVASPISPTALIRSTFDSAWGGRRVAERAKDSIAAAFGSSNAVLTDSGTSALVLALRAAVPPGGTVAFPGYACVDLTAAALFAGVKVRLYDVDPQTLSADLASVEQVLRRGVDAVVVAHLFGYPSDVAGVRALAAQAGVPVIEDAAQCAGGSLGGRRLGTLGDLVVLSFGRGKGLCAGGGGALLGFGPRWARLVSEIKLGSAPRGWSGLAKTGVQWVLGRPSLYAIPSMIPWLHLGEMVYHPAREPTSSSVGSCALLPSALALEKSDLLVRRRRAQQLDVAARRAPSLAVPAPIASTEPGYLRFAVRDLSGKRQPDPRLGVLRSYPRTLAEQPELQPLLMAGEPPVPGASDLRRSLYTLPTHRFVTDADLAAMVGWLGAQELAVSR